MPVGLSVVVRGCGDDGEENVVGVREITVGGLQGIIVGHYCKGLLLGITIKQDEMEKFNVLVV